MTKAPLKLSPGDPGSILNRRQREIERDRLASGQSLDVLVIGGGITGTGVALDAASRGLSVALVERNDLASGTSSYSSKLVHGGLRYLAKGDVPVAWESAAERSVLASRVAPHLIHPLGQLSPIHAGDQFSGYLPGMGFVAGDLLRVATRTPRGLLKPTRRISADKALHLAPTLRREGLKGAMLGWDCQIEDDARLVVAVARTAAAFGAHVLTQTEAISVNPGNTIVRDRLTNETYEISARQVINATGVWAGSLDDQVHLNPSVGTHIVLRSESLGDSPASITVPVPGSFGRFVFTLPQADGLTYVGLTDTELTGEVPDDVTPTSEDISWLINRVSAVLEQPLTTEDVVGSFAAMRPLVTDPTNSDASQESESPSADISRKHYVSSRDGLVTITGGKLTTYRRMASDAVDMISDRPCRTRDISLIGSGPHNIDLSIPARLYRRYGSEAPLVWGLGEGRPELRQPVAPHIPTLGVEFAFGAHYELGLSVDDLVNRRTRIGLVDSDAALARPLAESGLTSTFA